MIKKMLKIISLSVASIYIVTIIIGCSTQTKLIFPSEKLGSDYKFDIKCNFEEVFLKTHDGEKINGLFFPANSKKVILYFHGNAGSLKDWQYIYGDLKSFGYNFFIIDYRGYGKSTGKITENGLYIDAQTAYNYLVDKGFEKNNIIVYGRSIGTGVAIELAKGNTINSLILEAPFTNFMRLANQKFPYLFPSLYLKYEFNNIDKINLINVPLLVIHGKNDNVIPFKHGKALFESFKGEKYFIEIETGGHNNLSQYPEFSDGILLFLTKVCK